MKRLLCFLILLIYIIPLSAQTPDNGVFKGIVLDDNTNEPLPLVTVQILDTGDRKRHV